MGVRGQPVVVSSYLPPCGFQESNSGHLARQQMPLALPAEPSHAPCIYNLLSLVTEIIQDIYTSEVENLSQHHYVHYELNAECVWGGGGGGQGER